MRHDTLPACDVAKPERRETLSMVDELRHQRSVAYAEADAELQLCKKQMAEAEKQLEDPTLSASKRKNIEYKLLRLRAKKAGLDRALEAAIKGMGAGGQRKASDLAPWVERRL